MIKKRSILLVFFSLLLLTISNETNTSKSIVDAQSSEQYAIYSIDGYVKTLNIETGEISEFDRMLVPTQFPML